MEIQVIDVALVAVLCTAVAFLWGHRVGVSEERRRGAPEREVGREYLRLVRHAALSYRHVGRYEVEIHVKPVDHYPYRGSDKATIIRMPPRGGAPD